MPEQIPLAAIRTDGGTQPRASINFIVVAEYAEAMQEGAAFPPVTVFYDGADYWLADGFHRYHAARRLEWTDIAADVRQGTRRDAVLYSVGANREATMHNDPWGDECDEYEDHDEESPWGICFCGDEGLDTCGLCGAVLCPFHAETGGCFCPHHTSQEWRIFWHHERFGAVLLPMPRFRPYRTHAFWDHRMRLEAIRLARIEAF